MVSDELAYMDWLLASAGYAKVAPLPGGRWVGIQPLLFHWTMHIGIIGDYHGYEDRYCYADEKLARDSFDEWLSRRLADEPINWHRHPATGRRRANGSPEEETINW